MRHEDFYTVPMSALTSAEKQGVLMVYRDHWWAVDDKGHALFYAGPRGTFKTPQANSHLGIVQRQVDAPEHPAVAMKFVPWAYVPINISDYT